jgi:hypothetical protein
MEYMAAKSASIADNTHPVEEMDPETTGTGAGYGSSKKSCSRGRLQYAVAVRISTGIFEHIIAGLGVLCGRGKEWYDIIIPFMVDSAAVKITNMKAAWNGSLQPLATLLRLYCNYDATDEQDRVYASHGLASNVTDLAVDYSIDTRELFLKVLPFTMGITGLDVTEW